MWYVRFATINILGFVIFLVGAIKFPKAVLTVWKWNDYQLGVILGKLALDDGQSELFIKAANLDRVLLFMEINIVIGFLWFIIWVTNPNNHK